MHINNTSTRHTAYMTHTQTCTLEKGKKSFYTNASSDLFHSGGSGGSFLVFLLALFGPGIPETTVEARSCLYNLEHKFQVSRYWVGVSSNK